MRAAQLLQLRKLNGLAPSNGRPSRGFAQAASAPASASPKAEPAKVSAKGEAGLPAEARGGWLGVDIKSVLVDEQIHKRHH